MKYLIGIDGGGTGSTCVITDPEGSILFRCKGGPTNFLKYDVREVCENIYFLINKCCLKLKISFKEIDSVAIGTAGAGRKKDALFLEKELRKYLNSKRKLIRKIKVFSDGIIALEGAFPGKRGCILISGTGSIIYGKNKSGEYYRLGGYGNKIGDEGSGYSIGRKGLNAVSKFFDGRGEKTLLADFLKKNYKIDSGQKLIDRIYMGNFDIASFAPYVIKSAGKRDRVSVKILNEESDELVTHLRTMIKLLEDKKTKLVLSGSIISGKNYFSDLLKKKISSGLSKIEIVEPVNSPEAGAALLGKSYK